jgi:hypothetical protein
MHARPSPALAQLLQQWPGSYYWSDEPDGHHLVLTRPLARRRERWGLHLALFLATLYTITFAGAVLANGIPYTGWLVFFTSGYPGYPGFLHAWASGLPFAAPLLAILLCHELGHYVVARRYQLDVSPPYFIPVPMFPTFIGTMGAFIRLRTVLSDRRQTNGVRRAFERVVRAKQVRQLHRRAVRALDPRQRLVDLVEETAHRLGRSTRRMPSGAGHDAQMLARLCPTAMVFTPSVNGLSHNIAEFTEADDIEAGANVLLQVILHELGTR